MDWNYYNLPTNMAQSLFLFDAKSIGEDKLQTKFCFIQQDSKVNPLFVMKIEEGEKLLHDNLQFIVFLKDGKCPNFKIADYR